MASSPSPITPNDLTLTLSSKRADKDLRTFTTSPVCMLPCLYSYVSARSKKLSCSVITLVLPTAGAPSTTEPLPM